MRVLRVCAAAVAVLLIQTGTGFAAPSTPTAATDSVPRAHCGPGSAPEHGVQGQVPHQDRVDGRSALGYRCNLALVGQYQGQGGGVLGASYGHCSYLGSFFPGTTVATHRGVNVIDVTDPAHPRYSTTLTSPAMLAGTWESLKVDAKRGLLAATGVSVPPGTGALTFDIYDIKTDCAHPRLLNGVAGTNLTVPTGVVGHEGGFAPDGKTYYATSAFGGLVTAIDVADPTRPKIIYSGSVGMSNHGFSLSADGDTMYGVTAAPSAGVQILDVSDIQHRRPSPQIRQISSVSWTDGILTQMTIPFVSHGHHYLVAADEGFTGGVRIIDIDDIRHPQVVRELRLQIDQPDEARARGQDVGGDGFFGYDAHYCTLDDPVNPAALACGYWQSGIRVFNISNPLAPREVAYYNPPAQTGTANILRLGNSPHTLLVASPAFGNPDSLAFGGAVPQSVTPSMTTDLCSSPPQFVGADQLWVECEDNGFMVLRFTNDAKPQRGGPLLAPSSVTSSSHSPASTPSHSKHPTSPAGTARQAAVASATPQRTSATAATGRNAAFPLLFAAALIALGGVLIASGSRRFNPWR